MKPEKKNEARRLRLQGQSIRHIAEEISVSKGSVSKWVRDIELKEEQRTALDEKRKEGGQKQSITKQQKLLERDFDSLPLDSKKRRVIIEQDNRCFVCGINEWCGKPLTLQVDHADGNNKNDSRSNLRGLCPNCHSQTPTYCGKHRKNGKVFRVTDELLLSALLSSKSISQALAKVGYHRCKAHADRCKRIITEHSIRVINDLVGICKQCGNEFIKQTKNSTFCTRECAGKYRNSVNHPNKESK